MSEHVNDDDLDCIAVIGMACRMPGAPDAQAYWDNVAQGREAIQDLDEAQLQAAGVAAELLANPRYVRRSSDIDGVDLFDAPYFDFTPREATITAPSQRLLLMCANDAFENAGYAPNQCNPNVGVFVGVNRCDEWQKRLYGLAASEGGEVARLLQFYIANDLDYAATRISYKFNLTGPSFNVSTACSTSLVAVHQACRALLAFECDMALAGGASVVLPQHGGYLYQEGGIQSHDGRCRAFDASADGTVFGNGAGVVLLKRLDEALADRDHIHAVIRGSAINNDGSAKVGYTAPSVQGQASVIMAALEAAGVHPNDIAYVETHGTGTSLGDPIEIEALTRAYRARTRRQQYCAIGSVKPNIGHLGAAAGIAGLIKGVQALKHRQMPPSLHFERPNPEIDFASSPFFVNTQLRPWDSGATPRRAAVSSFGVGGTNAHVILEEAPSLPDTTVSRGSQLLTVSARTPQALQARCEQLARHLEGAPQQDLADVAYTLNTGRRAHSLRHAVVAADRAQAVAALQALAGQAPPARPVNERAPMLAFLFPGQGSQYPDMLRGLYDSEPLFRDTVDHGAHLLEPALKRDIRNLMYPREDQRSQAEAALQRTEFAQPALFLVEYALARQLEAWGLKADAFIGHSIGEYVAACLAGVFTLADALSLVAVRGRLMQTMAPGHMVAVALSEEAVRPLLGECSLAAINGSQWCVVSGPTQAMAAFEERLGGQGRKLHTSHGFHSSTADAILDEYLQALRAIRLHAPSRRFISNVTGTWIKDTEAVNPNYWLRQLREAVRFHPGVQTLQAEGQVLMLEVGPGQALSSLVRADSQGQPALAWATARGPKEAPATDLSLLLNAVAQAWCHGVPLDWSAFYAGERRARVPLPTYPYQGQRHWLDQACAYVAAPGGPAAQALSEPTAGQAATSAGQGGNTFLARWRSGSDVERLALLKAFVKRRVQTLLGVQDDVDEHTALIELGLSSLMAIELRTELNTLSDNAVSVMQLLDERCSISALAEDLSAHLAAQPDDPQDGQAAAAIAAQAAATPATQTLPPATGLAEDAGGEPRQTEAAPTEALEALPPGIQWITPDEAGQYQPFPLTEIQQAYWIGRHGTHGQAGVATYAYIEMEIRDLDVPRYQAALRQLIERHHMLRMVIGEDGLQRFLQTVPAYEIEVEDMRGLSDTLAQARLDEIREGMSHQVLDPRVWPLFQLRISRLSDERFRLHYGFDFLIVDVLSLLVFFRDLFLIYVGEAQRLSPLHLSYRDYVLHEKAHRASPAYERAKAYWLARVDQLPAAPALPYACEPASIVSPRYVRRDFELDADTWGRIKARARRHKLTPSVVIATAFSEVLAQWCTSPRFTLNLTLFNRPRLHPEMNDLIGDFTSSVLLEVDMGGTPRFEDAARAIQAQLMGDLEHRHFSGVEVLRALNSQRGGYQAAIMPIVLTSALGLDQHAERKLAGMDAPQLALYEEMMTLGHTISQTSQVYLDHVVREKSGRLQCNWDALASLFPGRVLDDMFCAYYDRLIQMADDTDAVWQSVRPTALPMDQQVRRDRVNATQAPISEALLHALFEQAAVDTPEALAVVQGDVRLSYRALHVAATRLGASLRAQGMRPNELVGVVMDKGWEQIVAVMGILFAGAAYMPVDASLPPERVRHLLSQGEVRVALTQGHLRDAPCWPDKVAVQTLGAEQLAVAQAQGSQPIALSSVQGPTDLAYVLFTSGSTGTPKGVMIDHRSAVNTVLDINQRFGVGPRDRVLAINALNFDLSVYDVFGILAAGGALVMPQAERALDPAHWEELVRRERVTFWNTVPALVQLYVEALEKGPGAAQDQVERAIRLVFMSGDWIPVGLPDRIRAALPQARPISLGGPTETTVWSIFYPIGEVPADWKSIPYGKPLSNRQHHVLHADGTPCPDWVAGDIYTGGAVGLSQGYWRDPQRSAEVFTRHPVTGEPLYKTGDVGRFLPDGNIAFVGRSDFQVKVQGHRIELGEIEHALRQCEDVADALVLAVSEGEGEGDTEGRAGAHGARLVAYVVEQDACEADRSLSELIAASGVLMDPLARAAFKLTHPGLRRFDEGARAHVLPQAGHAPAQLRLHRHARWSLTARTQKQAPAPVTCAQLGAWLNCLREVALPDAALPKYYYPSAGSAHPVQAYLCVGAGAVFDLPAGVYYHDPAAHRLVPLAGQTWTGQGLRLLLVCVDEAIQPLYGEVGVTRFAPIEAGHMATILLASAPAAGLRLSCVPASSGLGEVDIPDLALQTPHRWLACLDVRPAPEGTALEEGASAWQELGCLARQSIRQFPSDTVEASALHQLLAPRAGAAGAEGPGLGLDPDATPAFQVLLYTKPGRVRGLPSGLYQVDRATGRISLRQHLPEGLRGNLQYLENGRVHASSAFSLLFIGDQQALGDAGLLAVGAWAQTLLQSASELALGLCPTGGGKVELIREHLALPPGQQICYCIEGGAVHPEQLQRWDNVEPVPMDPRQVWRDVLAARLPYYMVPTQFVRLKHFPLTANGKVDRKALSRRLDSAPAPIRTIVAPRDELERRVHGVWLRLLALDEASVHDNLFESGGDSLVATKMIAELAPSLGVNLPLHKVFADPTIAGMAEQYRALLGAGGLPPVPADESGAPGGAPVTARTADVLGGTEGGLIAQMRQDAVLDLHITADMSCLPDVAQPGQVLLTGASGYLGAHVLRALLDQTQAQVHCLVRAADAVNALARVRENLQRHHLWRATDTARLTAWAGDLSQPQLGLGPAAYEQLCQSLDVIYHVGAQVNYARSYADMRATNVLGAGAVIALAVTAKLKAINFVSTKYVCFELSPEGVSVQGHEGPVASPEGMFVGYTQSKWVAEQRFQQASQLGVPVTIVRPGQITAAAGGRVLWPQDAFHHLVALFRSLPVRPHGADWADGAIDVVPVDHGAAALVAIGSRPQSYGRHFHLVNPSPMSMEQFFMTLARWRHRQGQPMQAVPFEDWAAACQAAVAAMDDRVAAFLLEKFFVPTEHGRLVKGLFVNAPLSCANVMQALADRGLDCPPVSEALWLHYLSAPSPQEAAAMSP